MRTNVLRFSILGSLFIIHVHVFNFCDILKVIVGIMIIIAVAVMWTCMMYCCINTHMYAVHVHVHVHVHAVCYAVSA